MKICLVTVGQKGEEMKKVWLLTTGSGADGDEWNVESIHATEESARKAKEQHEQPKTRKDGSTYFFEASIEEWDVIDG